MSQTARWLLAIAFVQAALVGGYWLVEQQRTAKTDESLGTKPPRRVDMPMPSLTVIRSDGSRGELAAAGRRTLVHVWATWCPPCRAELPRLLELPARHGVAVVAVALDPRWDGVARFLGDMDSSSVVLAASDDVERALDVRTLPVTFLVEAGRHIAFRFDGARDWTNEAFVRANLAEDVP